MGIKSAFSKPFAKIIAKTTIEKWRDHPIEEQQKVFSKLIASAKNTAFGQDHHFADIKDYSDFKRHVPVRDYEGLRPYIDRMVEGEKDILWPGKPLYLAKTSGTTSGTKYIPISKESMPEHIRATRNALLNYIHLTGKASFVDGKMIFLQGSPTLSEKNGIKVGRLSGIAAHYVPAYLQRNRLPTFDVNTIEDWETKVDAIVEQTKDQDMRLISGIPPWIQMYFERLSARCGGKKIKDIFPNYSLFVYGGVNFEPYRARLEELVGKQIDGIETYPASEGFIGFSDIPNEKGLLITSGSGIFYEFIPVEEYGKANATRLSLAEVKTGINYALILNTSAGLWGYSLGDTVRFLSTMPYRMVVTGRIKHFISAFGEHVIGEEVESALFDMLDRYGAEVTEFTVAPQVTPAEGLPYHEWFIEFAREPDDMARFAMDLDRAMQGKNTYYFDLIEGKVLRPLAVRPLRKEAFVDYMRSMGKLGGQNKLPRLSNDRGIADEIEKYIR